MKGEGKPLAPDYETVERWRLVKYNPLARLTPVSLASALDGFERGYLREAVLLWEAIADRDDVIKAVKPKREKAVSGLDLQVMPRKGSGEIGARHQEVLEDFWNNVEAVNAYDRNERGGRRRLVRQMMTAASFRYAVHHIVWRPGQTRLRATMEFVPLWLFENRTGSLRYLRDPFGTVGEDLKKGEWMTTVGDGLMTAASILYFAKRATMNDWLIFSDKFSVPGVLGMTTAAKGTPEGDAMKGAVAAVGHDMAAVLYNYSGENKDPIKFLSPNGNPQAMPMPAMIERADRRLAALWRGQDLSSMSSGPNAEGAGASLMADEADILVEDDAAAINDALGEVSKLVIEWYFGRGVEPEAEAKIIVPADEDGKFLLEASMSLADRGAPVSVSSTMERLSIQRADDPADVLQGTRAAAPPPATQAVRPAEANALGAEVVAGLAALLAGEVIEAVNDLTKASKEETGE